MADAVAAEADRDAEALLAAALVVLAEAAEEAEDALSQSVNGPNARPSSLRILTLLRLKLTMRCYSSLQFVRRQAIDLHEFVRGLLLAARWQPRSCTPRSSRFPKNLQQSANTS